MALSKGSNLNSFNGFFQTPEITAPAAVPVQVSEPDAASYSPVPDAKKSKKKKQPAEVKSRYNYCMTPSLNDTLGMLAALENMSKSELLEKLVKDYARKRKNELEKLNALYEEMGKR